MAAEFCSQLHPSHFSEFKWIIGAEQSYSLAEHSVLHLFQDISYFSPCEFSVAI